MQLLKYQLNALEKRDVVILDIPGAFMQTDMNEVVHVKFEGEIAGMLVKLDPKSGLEPHHPELIRPN